MRHENSFPLSGELLEFAESESAGLAGRRDEQECVGVEVTFGGDGANSPTDRTGEVRGQLN